jgi:CBS domain-containing protein
MKKMPTYAKDIMTTELILGHPRMTIEEAIKTLVNNRITGMPVVDENRRLIGVVSEYHIIKSVESTKKNRPINLGQTINYSSKVTTITEEAHLSEILRHFVERKIRRLPVINKEKQLVGIITRRDIMRVLFYRSKTL